MTKRHSFFLLVANRASSLSGGHISAEVMARRRLSAGKWGLYANTPHKSEIRPGDVLIIYLAGYGEMRFFAQATAGEISTNTRNYSAEGNALTDPPVAILALNNVEIFRNPVAIASIKNRLEFVPKNTVKWGCVLQRGAKRITEADANLIIREANNPPLVAEVGT